MNKKVFLFSAVLLMLSFMFISCETNNNNDVAIDEEWKLMNEKAFAAIEANKSFVKVYSQSEEGFVMMKDTTSIKDSDKSIKITTNGTPQFTDTVMVRYEGWIYNKKGEKVIFDSTERPLTGNSYNPNKRPIKFSVNGKTSANSGYSIDGWTTALQLMKEGEEKLICIPSNLGYGARGNTTIPPYSTLYFDVMIVKIIPM